MMNSHHSIEPELQRPAPRPVRARTGKKSGGIGCLRVFILPHMLVGIFVLLAAVSMTLVNLFGANIPATITGHYTTNDSDGDTTYRVNYSYTLNGQRHNDEAKVSAAEYAAPVGTVVALKIFPAVPVMGKQLMLPETRPYGRIGFFWIFALFWNGLLSLFVWVAYVAPAVQRKLVSQGTPCVGRIIDKQVSSGEGSDSYYLRYEYAPVDWMDTPAYTKALEAAQKKNRWTSIYPAPGMLAGLTAVNQSEYESVQTGDAVTVLYNPEKPLQSAVYRFCGHEIAL